MPIKAFEPSECTHVDAMEIGKLYVLPCAYMGHSAYVKSADGLVRDQTGKPTDEEYFKPLENPEGLASDLESEAEHNTILAKFIKQHTH